MERQHLQISRFCVMLSTLVLVSAMSACTPRPVASSLDTVQANNEQLMEEPQGEHAMPIDEAATPVDEVPIGTLDIPLEGKWKAIGDQKWGIVSPGSIVIFNGQETNIFSPKDIYALYEDGGNLRLDLTGALGGNASFTVKVVDNSTIELTREGETQLVLSRLQ